MYVGVFVGVFVGLFVGVFVGVIVGLFVGVSKSLGGSLLLSLDGALTGTAIDLRSWSIDSWSSRNFFSICTFRFFAELFFILF